MLKKYAIIYGLEYFEVFARDKWLAIDQCINVLITKGYPAHSLLPIDFEVKQLI